MRQRILIALTILAGLAGAIWMVVPTEPGYDGKPLGVWLDDQHWVGGGRIELPPQSVHAVRVIGPSAIPVAVFFGSGFETFHPAPSTRHIQSQPLTGLRFGVLFFA